MRVILYQINVLPLISKQFFKIKMLCLLAFLWLIAPLSFVYSAAPSQKIKIATSIDNMPFHFADEQGNAVGMFIDLWKLWSQKTGVAVEFVPKPWAQSLDIVRTGKADIHAGCFFSAQRDTYLDYAQQLRDCQTHFFFHDSIYGLKTLADLKGFHIGVLDKDYAVEFVRRQMPDAALKLYKSHQELFDGVEAGDVKVFICDTPTALYFLDRNELISRFRYHPTSPLYKKPFFAAVKQGNEDLIKLVNKGLAQITPSERAAIERRWIGKAPEQPKDRIIIGLDQAFPPFSMHGANGQPSGLWVDLWRAWSVETGREVVLRLYDRKEAVHALKDGIIDILSSFPPKKDTMEWAGFCIPNYRLDWYLYITGSAGSSSLFDMDLKNQETTLNIGVLDNSRVNEKFIEQGNRVKVVGFDSTALMILASGNKRIDAFVATAQEMAVLPGQLGVAGDFSRSRLPLFNTQIYPRVRNVNPGLVHLVESGFNRIPQVKKSDIEAKWISEPKLRVFGPATAGVQLSDAEEQWLTTHKLSGVPVKVGVEPSLPPFEFIGKDQKYQGMVSEVVAYLTQRLGMNIEIVPDPKDPSVDIIPAALSFKEETPDMAYTRSYLDFPWVIITSVQAPLITGMMDLDGKTLACRKRGQGADHVKQQWPGIQVKEVRSTREGLNAVLSGKVDGFLENLALAGYQIQANNYTQLKVAAAAAMENNRISIAVRKDWPELVSILNKSIDAIDQSELDRIRQKWFTVRFDQGADLAFIQKMSRWIAFGVFLGFGLVLFWNRMIRRREERFRCLTEHGTDIIQAFDETGRLIYASPSHTSVLGYPMKQVNGRSVYELVHPEDADEFRKMIRELANTGKTANRIYRMPHFDGHDLFFESHCMDLTANKSIKAFVINGRDITESLKTSEEIVKAKESAEAANRKKTDFLAGLSHEVRTPLNAILGMTEMTLATQLNEGQHRNLNTVLSAARHLKAVISDILDFSTIEAGKMKVFQKNFRMDTLLDSLTHIWQTEAEAKELKFILEQDKDIPRGVRSDPVRLNQILTNLLSNAVKFTTKGQISLNVEVAHPPFPEDSGSDTGSLQPQPLPFDADPKSGEKRLIYVSFKVQDTGIGIENDHLEKIFQRFAQAQGKITREYGGTGLGLSICREMARMLGGSISVESQPGKGSCFILTLPLIVLPYPVDEFSLDKEDIVMPRAGLTVLLAEDDPVNRKVFIEMTAQLQCKVITVPDGEKALETLKENDVDMVFMDIEMPRMDGLTASRYIRQGNAGDHNKNIPIIAMTAHVLNAYRARAKAAGMDEFIPKPIEYKELVRVVHKHASQEGPDIVCDDESSDKDIEMIDRNQALSAMGGNVELLDKILAIFISETPGLISTLKTALASEKRQDIILAAHTLKGAGARIYAQDAVRMAARLERLSKGKDNSMEDIQKAGRDALTAFEKVIHWLENNKTPQDEPL